MVGNMPVIRTMLQEFKASSEDKSSATFLMKKYQYFLQFFVKIQNENLLL